MSCRSPRCRKSVSVGRPEIRRIASEIHASADRIVLMPEGTDPCALREKSQWLAEMCKDSGYRFTPRLHVDLWGNRRGV